MHLWLVEAYWKLPKNTHKIKTGTFHILLGIHVIVIIHSISIVRNAPQYTRRYTLNDAKLMHQMTHTHLCNYNWLIEFDSIQMKRKWPKILFSIRANSIPHRRSVPLKIRRVSDSSACIIIIPYAPLNHAYRRVRIMFIHKYSMRPPTVDCKLVVGRWSTQAESEREEEREKCIMKIKCLGTVGTNEVARANKLLSIRFNIGFDGRSLFSTVHYTHCVCVFLIFEKHWKSGQMILVWIATKLMMYDFVTHPSRVRTYYVQSYIQLTINFRLLSLPITYTFQLTKQQTNARYSRVYPAVVSLCIGTVHGQCVHGKSAWSAHFDKQPVVWRQLSQLAIPPLSNERKKLKIKFLAVESLRGGRRMYPLMIFAEAMNNLHNSNKKRAIFGAFSVFQSHDLDLVSQFLSRFSLIYCIRAHYLLHMRIIPIHSRLLCSYGMEFRIVNRSDQILRSQRWRINFVFNVHDVNAILSPQMWHNFVRMSELRKQPIKLQSENCIKHIHTQSHIHLLCGCASPSHSIIERLRLAFKSSFDIYSNQIEKLSRIYVTQFYFEFDLRPNRTQCRKDKNHIQSPTMAMANWERDSHRFSFGLFSRLLFVTILYLIVIGTAHSHKTVNVDDWRLAKNSTNSNNNNKIWCTE